MPTPAEQLLEAALAPTRVPETLKRPRLPRNLERRYERLLKGISRAMTRAIAGQLRRVVRVRQDVDDLDLNNLFQILASLRRPVRQIIARTFPLLKRVGMAVNKHNAEEMRRTLAIPVNGESAVTAAALQAWRTRNIELLASLGDRLLNDVQSVLSEGAVEGIRSEVLAKRLTERFRVSESRAQLIARDQVLKFNGELTRARHLDAGITKYIWSTSRDEKVRPEHRALNGQTFSWDNPPPPGHPGQDIQCRCVARAVLD